MPTASPLTPHTIAPGSLVDAICARIEEQPDWPALIWRGKPLSYGELGFMARSAEVVLRGLDAPPGAPVALVARKSPYAIAMVLACLATRRPIVLPSADLPRAALDAVIASSGASHVLHTGDIGGVIVAATKRAQAPVPGAALLLTTSGSTGAPKVVPIAQPAIDRFASWAGPRFAIDAGTTVLNCAPLNFDLCLLDIWTSLARGATVVLVDQVETTHAGRLLDLLLAQRVAVVQAVPLCLRLLVDAARERGRRIRCVEQLIVTGEALRPAALEALAETFDAAVMHNVYGCTETNDSFCGEIDVADARRRGAIAIGRPLPGVRARLVGDGGAIVAGPGVGELWVSTPFQTSGYLDASLNAARFVAGVDADDPPRTYFRTGDLVRRHPDGELTVEGRADLQVKVRGVRVDRAAVEGVLAEHPAVSEAAVLTSHDEAAGTLLHAVVRRRPGGAVNGLVLRSHCAARLPVAAIPARMTLVDRPLPRTSTGKLDRPALGRDLAEHPLIVSTPATTR